MTAATVQPRVLPARGLGRGPRLAISLLGLLSLYTGGAGTRPAAAQPSAVPLPVVIYPSRDPDTAPPDRSSSAVPPAPPRGIGEAEPEPYVLVDGVWGYWDRAGHFHRRPALIGRAPPFNRIATHGVIVL